ncbi:MAG: heparinase, partial [Candidatus Poribacteria bacterium]
LFVKPDLFVIADTFTPNDDDLHSYQIRWHVDTQAWTPGRQDDVHYRHTGDDGEPNLAIFAVDADGMDISGNTAVTDPELLGWWVQRDGNHRPTTTGLHTRTGLGRQSFLTVLYPMPAGSDALPTVRRVDDTTLTVGYPDGRSVDIVVDPDPGLPLTFGHDGR